MRRAMFLTSSRRPVKVFGELTEMHARTSKANRPDDVGTRARRVAVLTELAPERSVKLPAKSEAETREHRRAISICGGLL